MGRRSVWTMSTGRIHWYGMAYQSGMAFEQLATLVAVVDANGFAAAARATNLRKATISQRIQQLEKRLGVSLLVRTTRSLRVTDEGRAYVEQARRALEAVAQAEQVIAAAKHKPIGVLRVTMHAALASMIFESVVLPYMANNPDVSVHIDTSMRQLDLAREGFDLAVRTGIGPLAESSFIARRIGMTPSAYTASPRWVATHGGLRRPEDLTDHPTIVIEEEGPHEWSFVVNGRTRVVCRYEDPRPGPCRVDAAACGSLRRVSERRRTRAEDARFHRCADDVVRKAEAAPGSMKALVRIPTQSGH